MTADRAAQGQKITSRGEGTYEWLREGDAVLFGLGVSTVLGIEADGHKTERKSSILTVYDGQYMYTYTEEAGRKLVAKTRLDPRLGPDVRAFFQALREQHSLELLKAEGVSGQDAYVIQATPKKPRPDGHTYRHYFSKDDGALLKTALCDQDGKAVERTGRHRASAA